MSAYAHIRPIVNYTGSITVRHGLYQLVGREHNSDRLVLRGGSGESLRCVGPDSITPVPVPRLTVRRAQHLQAIARGERTCPTPVAKFLAAHGLIEVVDDDRVAATHLGWEVAKATYYP